MHRSVSLTASLFCLLSLNLVACDGQVEELDSELGSEQQEILDNLDVAGFDLSAIEVDEQGAVIVGGDAVVTLEASRELAEGAAAEQEGFRQYHTHALVTTNGKRTIMVRGATNRGDGSDLDATMQSALIAAIDEYNALGLDITFVLTFGASNDADMVVYRNASGGYYAQAGFPSGGNPYKWNWLGNNVSSYGVTVTKHVIMHEIGHSLGMRHTDWFDRSIGGCAPSSEAAEPYGANHIPGTSAGATFNGSVMNACYNANVSGQWSADDRTAFQYLYDTTPTKNVSWWCGHPEATLYEGDFDGDGVKDLLCHDTMGTSWIDYASNGLWGTDWEQGGWCGHGGSQFGVGDFDGDGKDDFYCHDTNNGYKWIDYANNGFGGTDWHRDAGWCNHN